MPSWTGDEAAEINAYIKSLQQKERQARIAGGEIDAALNDPRWMAISPSSTGG